MPNILAPHEAREHDVRSESVAGVTYNESRKKSLRTSDRKRSVSSD